MTLRTPWTRVAVQREGCVEGARAGVGVVPVFGWASGGVGVCGARGGVDTRVCGTGASLWWWPGVSGRELILRVARGADLGGSRPSGAGVN